MLWEFFCVQNQIFNQMLSCFQTFCIDGHVLHLFNFLFQVGCKDTFFCFVVMIKNLDLMSNPKVKLGSAYFCSCCIFHQIFKCKRALAVEPAVVISQTYSYCRDEILFTNDWLMLYIVLFVFLKIRTEMNYVSCSQIVSIFRQFVDLIHCCSNHRVVNLVSNFDKTWMSNPTTVKSKWSVFELLLFSSNDCLFSVLRLTFSRNQSTQTSNSHNTSFMSCMDDFLIESDHKVHELSLIWKISWEPQVFVIHKFLYHIKLVTPFPSVETHNKFSQCKYNLIKLNNTSKIFNNDRTFNTTRNPKILLTVLKNVCIVFSFLHWIKLRDRKIDSSLLFNEFLVIMKQVNSNIEQSRRHWLTTSVNMSLDFIQRSNSKEDWNGNRSFQFVHFLCFPIIEIDLFVTSQDHVLMSCQNIVPSWT